MTFAPKISIVTPSYNQRAYIEDALLSVKDQGYAPVEHIVVDGASTDGTVELLQEYSQKPGWDHLLWISEADGGQSDALNKGFKLATGDLIGWLNSDDQYRSGCFATVTAAAREYPNADILYGNYAWMDEDGQVWRIRREIEFSRFILWYHRVNYIPTTATFFRRRIFDEGNWIDTSLDYAMDYEFFLRLAWKDYRFRHMSGLLANFRWHRHSKSGAQQEKQLLEHDAVLIRYSRVLRSLPPGVRTFPLALLRTIAAGLRWSEKLVTGCYF